MHLTQIKKIPTINNLIKITLNSKFKFKKMEFTIVSKGSCAILCANFQSLSIYKKI